MVVQHLCRCVVAALLPVTISCGSGNSSSPTAPTPSPTSTQTPTPTPTPTPTFVYDVWGGPNYSVYLGSFSCMFCTSYDIDSINNRYGDYGSAYSSLSIRNRYGDYGSQYSDYSPCNTYASRPPRIYGYGVYDGVLTVNRYASGYNSYFYSWLVNDVCNY